jgi:leucyl aminopeptidase
MTVAQSAVKVDVVTLQAPAVETELLVLPVFEDELPGEDHQVALATAGDVSRACGSGEFKGRLFDLLFSPIVDPRWKARRLVLAGLGRRADYHLDRLRRVATAAALAGRKRRHTQIGLLWSGGGDLALIVQAAVEGLLLADFDGARYKTGDDAQPPVRAFHIVLDADTSYEARTAASRGAERGRILGESCNVARSLATEPGNLLTPRVFAERASAVARDAGLGVEVLDEGRIGELGMGLLLAVARGSAEPPRVIVLRHTPPDAPAGVVLGLVGKGITFDSGGISIKPADGMERMKDDMAGGAAVICAMRAIALLEAPIRVVGIVPTSENMP